METPGFGFNPTEEQLFNYYLHHKICGNDNKVSAIAEIDHICNYEPWDLPMLAAIPSKDTWHFFHRPDHKYRKSGNNKRVTRAGYWKVTGKKREIRDRAKNQVIGIKRILVFYGGRVRDPVWTKWTVHEYQLNHSYSNRNYVISRLHKKPPKKTVNSALDEVEPGHDLAFEVENPVTDFTFPEIDPQFMGKLWDSNDQYVTSPTAQQPEWHCSQGPSNVYLQHTNGGVTDDYTMSYSEMDPRFMVGFLDSNEEDVTFSTTQQLELHCSQGPSNVYLEHTNGITDDYTLPLSKSGPQFMEEFLDSIKQDVTFPTTQQPELHCSQGPSNVYLQHSNGVTDAYTMPLSEVDPPSMVEFLDPNYQDVTSPTAQQLGLHCSQVPSDGYLQHTNGVTDDYTMPYSEIDPQCMLEFWNSNDQDVSFPFPIPTAQQPGLQCSQYPSNVYFQHVNGLTDDYTLPLSQFGSGYLQDNNREAMKMHPAIQDVQHHSGSMHTALDDSSASESLVSPHIGDINDTEAVKATVDRCLREMHTMQGLSYENLQKTNNVADECNLLPSQFVASEQQDKLSDMVRSYPPIQDVHFYRGSMRISPSDSSPSESSVSLLVKNISDTEAINAAPEGGSDSVWDQWLEHASAYFSST